jgi:CHAT domain-containing protein
MASSFAALFAKVHFDAFGKPEHLEEAIYRLRTALGRIPPQDSNRSSIMANLSYLEGFRFDSSSITATAREVAEARSNPSNSAKIPLYKDLTASLHGLDDSSIPEESGVRKQFVVLKHTSILRLTDIADIEDAIEYCRELITSHPHSPLASMAFVSLIILFHRAFECTNQIEYLNEAILTARLCMNIIPSQRGRGVSLISLITLLSIRLVQLHRTEDLDELMQAFAQAAELERLGPLRRQPYSSRWALVARRFGHPSTLTAYDCAMSSMEDTLTFSPTLDTQHFRLAAQLFTRSKALPFDYTSYLIHTGRLKQAIETLERGRVLLWSEMRGLRTSVDQIRLADSNLADKFVAVNRDLENLTFTFSLITNVDGGDSGVNGMDPFRHLVVQQQKLLDDREMLISQIQALPGFDSFLKPPSFDTLYSATSHGPVIVINHSKWRSDIVILLRDSPPSLISTSDDFYARTKGLQDQLLGARKKGLESVKYEDALRFVLKELYELVGRPVIKRLNELNVPEQSRVWWCPTSVFCSLPLHAMGPIPSDGNSQRYFLDLYISSYIPSLEALIASQKPSSQVITKPSVLLVAQPDENMPKALKEMRVVQVAGTNVTTLFSAKATPAAVLARLRDHSFAHIVSHGILEPGKPFEASFKLHRGKRLRLLDIARSHLPNAEFAFLSACHTAELTEESIADEALHLAAAMQFCGFRSVVGTLWAMADTDGRDLARWFYESVFSGESQGERYYERTAGALRDAVVKLRRKGGMSLERWVNFVHYGV